MREIASGKVHVLQTGGFYPRYFNGHVAFVRDGVLNVLGFDASTLTVTSPPVPVIPNVHNALGSGAAQYSVSDNGTLIYIPGFGASSLEYEMDGPGRTVEAPGGTGRDLPAAFLA